MWTAFVSSLKARFLSLVEAYQWVQSYIINRQNRSLAKYGVIRLKDKGNRQASQ